MLTIGLLMGFSISRNSAMASTQAAEVIDQANVGEAVRAQDTMNSAHLVVQFSDGDTAVRPVTWTGTISRVGALKSAGFAVEHTGDTVCSIDGDGCPATDCWCADNLWAQGQWAGTTWDDSAWPPPNPTDSDVVAFRNGTQPDYSDWGLKGFLPGAPTYVAASDAAEWMRDQQQSDGSYPSWAGPIAGSVRSLIALHSVGYDPDEWGSPSLLNFLTVVSKTETANYAATGAAEAGRLALGAAWTDQTVTDFAGINLPVSITTYYSPTSGAYGDGSGDTAWAMLGLHAAGDDIPTQTVSFLKGVQNTDGGWSWNEWGTDSEVQHTALCIQALLAAGEPVTSTELADALSLIESGKNSDGGYGYMVGDASDLNTTVYVIQSLLAAGQDPVGNWCATTQCRYLFSKQEANGSFPGYAPLYSVQEAIPALMHRPYGPLAPWTYNCYANYLPLVANNVSSGPSSDPKE
jgi:hypothetical protein